VADCETRSKCSKTDRKIPRLALQKFGRKTHVNTQTLLILFLLVVKEFTVAAGHNVLQILDREISVGENAKGHADLFFQN
jgi:hypothetical protein